MYADSLFYISLIMSSAYAIYLQFIYFKEFQAITAIMCPSAWSSSAFDTISLDTAARHKYVSSKF